MKTAWRRLACLLCLVQPYGICGRRLLFPSAAVPFPRYRRQLEDKCKAKAKAKAKGRFKGKCKGKCKEGNRRQSLRAARPVARAGGRFHLHARRALRKRLFKGHPRTRSCRLLKSHR